MNVLIACEESQTVCLAFRKKGHNAYSCDIVIVQAIILNTTSRETFLK